MFEGMKAQELKDILSAVEPVELKGVALLKRRHPKARQQFPVQVNAQALAEAAEELIDYQGKCEQARERVANLPPVALEAPIEEWPL